MSPGLDFETKLIAKTNAADVLEQQLSKPGYVCAPINLGSNTDRISPSSVNTKSLGKPSKCCCATVTR